MVHKASVLAQLLCYTVFLIFQAGRTGGNRRGEKRDPIESLFEWVVLCLCVCVCLPLLLSGIVAGWLVFEVSCFGRRWFADVVVRRIA